VAHDRIELKLALVGFFRWLHGSTSAARHASLPWVFCDWERSTRQATARACKEACLHPGCREFVSPTKALFGFSW
jgi:hypothetical protein